MSWNPDSTPPTGEKRPLRLDGSEMEHDGKRLCTEPYGVGLPSQSGTAAAFDNSSNQWGLHHENLPGMSPMDYTTNPFDYPSVDFNVEPMQLPCDDLPWHDLPLPSESNLGVSQGPVMEDLMHHEFLGPYDNADSDLTTEVSCLSSTPRTHTPMAVKETLDFNSTGPQLETTGVKLTDWNACFGVIVASISSFADSHESKIIPLSFKPLGDNYVKLYTLDTSKYTGILAMRSICQLLRKDSVQLTMSLISSDGPQNQKHCIKTNETSAKEYLVRIVLHGMKEDKATIGDLLSEDGLFLQHPSLGECGRNVEYCNPHYLLRPGSQIPILEDSLGSEGVESSTQSKALDEVNMARLASIFDCADGDEAVMSSTVTTSPRLCSILMEHQLSALAMMTEKECGIINRPRFTALWKAIHDEKGFTSYRHIVTGISQSKPKPVNGGILADDMGLGKTLSVLALICSSLDQIEQLETRGTLIIAPKSTIPGWQNQIRRHVHNGQIRSVLYHGPARQGLANTFDDTDIILTTYETLRSEWDSQGPLFMRKWLRIVLDEAHHIRNRSSRVFQATLQLKSLYRWCLTGTPIHNSLDDFGSLLSFIGVEPFVERQMFNFWITKPIETKKSGSLRKLEDLVKATCLRRTKKSLTESLDLSPPIEEVEHVELHPEDAELYEFFKTKTASIAANIQHRTKGKGKQGANKNENILSLMNFLRLICNHGEYLLPPTAIAAWRKRESRSINLRVMQRFQGLCKICSNELGEADETLREIRTTGDDVLCRDCSSMDAAWESALGNHETETQIKDTDSPKKLNFPQTTVKMPPSAKIRALLRRLRAEQGNGEPTQPIKSVVFSSWTKMLDLVGLSLHENGIVFQRIDGKSTLESRSRALREFSEVHECTVMLASTGSCAEGVDFTAASNVHLLEPHWNPMAEAQAVDRVNRKGQTRQVTVIRYIVPESIETYIQWVQRDKLRLINQSINTTEVVVSEADDDRWKRFQICLQR